MEEIRAKEIMKSPLITAPSSASVAEIARIMKKNNIGGVIITENLKPVGIITRKDIVYKVVAEGKDANSVKAAEIMSSPLIYVNKEAHITEVAKLMGKHNIRRVLVKNGKDFVGIISDKDIIKVAPEIIEILSEYISILR